MFLRSGEVELKVACLLKQIDPNYGRNFRFNLKHYSNKLKFNQNSEKIKFYRKSSTELCENELVI